MGNHRKARFSFLSRVRPPSRQLSGDLIETPGSDVSAADFIYLICYILCMDIQKCISWYVTCYIHVSMYYQICCACVFIYILYHNISYVYIYMYICNTTHTWIHLNLSMYGMCGCGWHNHPGTKCVKLCTGIEERICIYSFHLDANSIRTKICMVYCQHAVGGTDHRALSSFYPIQVAWLGGWMVFAHCWWYIPAIVGGYWLVTSPLYSHYIPNTTYYHENCHDNCHNN